MRLFSNAFQKSTAEFVRTRWTLVRKFSPGQIHSERCVMVCASPVEIVNAYQSG